MIFNLIAILITATVTVTPSERVFFPLVMYEEAVEQPVYGLGSPENLLNYETYTDEDYDWMINEAYDKGYREIYMIAYGEDDPFLDPSAVDLWRWKGRVQLANSYGMEVKLFLAEEETMNNPYRQWYATAVSLFGDLDVEFVISEEVNQPPDELSSEEVKARCYYLRELGWEGGVGIHDVGTSVTGFWPFLVDDCIDTFLVQWFRTSDWRDVYGILDYVTDKEIILAESPTALTFENWCVESAALNDVGWGAMLYNESADLSWRWGDLPDCR